MYDIVTIYLTDAMIRCISIWTLSASAVMVFLLAFAVTYGAGFGSPLALLRGLQRFFLCAMAISMAYAAAYVSFFSWTPPGPFLILFVLFLIVTMISGIRHMMAPAIAKNDTWTGAWHLIRLRGFSFAIDHHLSEAPRRVRPF